MDTRGTLEKTIYTEVGFVKRQPKIVENTLDNDHDVTKIHSLTLPPVGNIFSLQNGSERPLMSMGLKP